MGVDNFYRQVLPNGLTVIFEKRDLPAVTTIASARFGSGYENEKAKGIAHFIEHSVFKRTKTRTQQEIAREIEKKGGEWNAFTAEEETGFWIKIGAEHFETSLSILSDVMLNPTFAKKDLEMERKVILEEIKMYHDNPPLFTWIKLKELLFASPFGLSPLGNPKVIGKMSKATIQKYHNIHYSPSNMVVSVVGKVDVDKIWNLSKHYFAKRQVQRQIERKGLKILPGPFGNFIEGRKNIDQANLAFGFHVPSMSSQERYAAEVMNTILGVGFSSRLLQEIREKRGLAYAVGSRLDQGKDYGYCIIKAGTEKKKVETVKKIILEEIKKLQQLEQRDLEESKEQLIGYYKLESEDSRKVAESLLREEMNGNAKEYYNYPEKIAAVNLEDVRKIAQIKDFGFVAVVPE